jgi:peroxiredoxin
MKAKKTFLLASLLLWGAGVATAGINYQVTVNNKAANGKTLMLRIAPSETDTVVVKNGKAVLSGTSNADAGTLCVLGTRDRSIADVSFFLDAVPVEVTNGEVVKGSSNNLRLAVVNKRIAQVDEKIKALLEAGKAHGFTAADTVEMKALYDSEDGIYKEEFYKNTDNLVGLLMAYYIGDDLTTDDMENVLAKNQLYANTRIYKNVGRKLQGMQKRGVGKDYIDLAMAGPDGVMHRISEYLGKGYLLVDFWASWCGPCRRELPNVKRAYEKYHSKGFDVLGISFDTKKEAWLKAINDLGLTWNHISDLKGWESEAAKQYAVTGIPCTILLDANGKIVASNLYGEKLEETLSELLK